MLVDVQDIGPICRGKLREIRTDRPPKVGTVQPVQCRRRKGGFSEARCHVLIEAVEEHPDGGSLVRLRPHTRRELERARLMRPGGGYSLVSPDASLEAPVYAMRAGPGELEAEALQEDELEAMAADNRRKARLQRSERRTQEEKLLDLEQQIAERLREAKRRRVDVRSEERLIAQLRARGKSLQNAALGLRRKLDQDLQAPD